MLCFFSPYVLESNAVFLIYRHYRHSQNAHAFLVSVHIYLRSWMGRPTKLKRKPNHFVLQCKMFLLISNRVIWLFFLPLPPLWRQRSSLGWRLQSSASFFFLILFAREIPFQAQAFIFFRNYSHEIYLVTHAANVQWNNKMLICNKLLPFQQLASHD